MSKVRLKDCGASLRAFPNAGLLNPSERNAVAKVRKRTWTTKTGERIAWVADYFAPGPDGKKRRHTKTFATKKAANAWLANTVVEIPDRAVHTPAHLSPTVLEAGAAWIAQAETDGLERASVRQYRQHLDLHIRPFLGHLKLAELTPASVQNFRTMLIRNHRRACWPTASSGRWDRSSPRRANGRVARNVVREQASHNRRRARIAKRHKRGLQAGSDIPTRDEIRRMLEHAGQLRPLLMTAVFTGLRASELRGLTWDAVDLERQVLTVRQRADRWNTIGSPKSDAARREVPLVPIVINTLRAWRLECPRSAGDGEPRLWLVFPNGEGNVERHANIHTRGLARPIHRRPHNQSGAPEIRATLRSARRGVEQGFSPKRVQALMGHSTTNDLRRLRPTLAIGR
jgi:integrase